MNIGKASKLSELTVKAVRYYDNIGLVKPHQNIDSGYREYSEEDILKLKFVGKARKFDFSIDECRELLSLYENKNRTSKCQNFYYLIISCINLITKFACVSSP